MTIDMSSIESVENILNNLKNRKEEISGEEEKKINSSLKQVHHLLSEELGVVASSPPLPPPPPPPPPPAVIGKSKLQKLIEKSEKSSLTKKELTEVISQAKVLRHKMIKTKDDKEIYRSCFNKKQNAGFWKIFLCVALDPSDKDYQNFSRSFNNFNQFLLSDEYMRKSLKDRAEAREAEAKKFLFPPLRKLMQKGDDILKKLSHSSDKLIKEAKDDTKQFMEEEKKKAAAEKAAAEKAAKKAAKEKMKLLEKSKAGKIIEFLEDDKNKAKFGSLKMKAPREGYIDMLKDMEPKDWNDDGKLKKTLPRGMEWEDIFK